MNESSGEAFVPVPSAPSEGKEHRTTGKKKEKKKKKFKRNPRLWAQFHSSSFDALQLAADALEWELLDGSRRAVADIIWLSCGETSHQMRKLASILDKTKLKSSTRLPLVSRIPGMSEVCSKVTTCLLLERARALFPELYEFVPRTFSLPEEKTAFQRYLLDQREALKAGRRKKSKGGKDTYIVKPDGGSQGDGIFLTQDPEGLIRGGAHGHGAVVVQRYISDPLLLPASIIPTTGLAGKNANLKFDLRIYVLVASIKPLRVFLCREGLARFCTEPYVAPNASNIKHSFMHLTNYSLNKRSSNYVHDGALPEIAKEALAKKKDIRRSDPLSSAARFRLLGGSKASTSENRSDAAATSSWVSTPPPAVSEEGASKRKISEVLRECVERCSVDIDEEQLWQSIQECVARTMIAVAPDLNLICNKTLRGFNNAEVRSMQYSSKNLQDLSLARKEDFFAVLGLDVLLDSNAQPHLLEINAHPSFSVTFSYETEPGITECCESPIDEEVKELVLSDALRIVQAESEIRRAATKQAADVDVDSLHRIYRGSFDLIVGSGSSIYDNERIKAESLDVLDLARVTFEKLSGRSEDIPSGKFCRVMRRVSDMAVAALDILFLKLTKGQKMRFEAFYDAVAAIAEDQGLEGADGLRQVLEELGRHT